MIIFVIIIMIITIPIILRWLIFCHIIVHIADFVNRIFCISGISRADNIIFIVFAFAFAFAVIVIIIIIHIVAPT